MLLKCIRENETALTFSPQPAMTLSISLHKKLCLCECEKSFWVLERLSLSCDAFCWQSPQIALETYLFALAVTNIQLAASHFQNVTYILNFISSATLQLDFDCVGVALNIHVVP